MSFHSSGGKIGKVGKIGQDFLVRRLSKHRVNPNFLTFTGLGINIAATVCFAKGLFFWAGLVVLFAGVFDMLDGAVARVTNRETRFGAFLDSVVDRYSDMLMLFGLMIWYAKMDRMFYLGLTGMVIIGSVMTSYTRARAESIIPACKVGFLERAERVVLLIIGALTDRLAVALWIMAILTNWTVIQRIWYTWREASHLEKQDRQIESEAAATTDEEEDKLAVKASLQT
jgi:CDP-diacylglycerol--glycerol-3-phosphate 3-phosphatidyltransferase